MIFNFGFIIHLLLFVSREILLFFLLTFADLFCKMLTMINIEKIESERIRQKISKYEMSKRLKMSRQSYYDILKRRSTSIDTLSKIGSILNIENRDLLI